MARKVIIAGAGASGLAAAVAAARTGAEVTVLEAMDRPGRKLLLTGNGRCNLTNMDPRLPSRYYGSGQGLAQSVTSRFGAEESRRFFEELGLLTVEKNGYVYPYTMQSSAVLGVLLAELRRRKVKLKLNERIERVEAPGYSEPDRGRSGSAQERGGSESDRRRYEAAQGQGDSEPEKRTSEAALGQGGFGLDNGSAALWNVKTSSWHYQADAVILACGSRCLPETGSDGSGYQIAAQLGHTVVTPRPALAALVCSGENFAALAGVRCRARVTLLQKGKPVKSEIGELQWTKYGVSGIVVFQLSRFASPGSTLSIDLLPEFDRTYLARLLSAHAERLAGETAAVLLKGILHEKLVPAVLARAGIRKSQTCAELGGKEIDALVSRMKAFALSVTGVRSFDECQVCSGGVDCKEVNAETLESKLHRNLYFAGELLDVDGPCGGYNLQWAWASGCLAGQAAARPCE